jgi:hypothetical protein
MTQTIYPGAVKSWSERRDPDLARDKARSLDGVCGIVLHTTGYGEGVRAGDNKHKGDEAAIGVEYARRMDRNLKYKGHFLIARDGTVYQFAPLEFAAWHTGGGSRPHYKGSAWKRALAGRCKWWPGRMRSLGLSAASPADLPAWQPYRGRTSVNWRTVGIDFLAARPGQDYTQAQLDAGAALVSWLCDVIGIVRSRAHVTDHSEISPWDRSKKDGTPWDFDARFPWGRFWHAVKTRTCS